MTSSIARRYLAPAALGATFLAAVAAYWCGLGPGDAERYIEPALRWGDGAYLGDTHWALRHLFVLPIAALFAALGPSELTATMPNVIYAALTVAVSWTFARRYLGAIAAIIVGALIATSAFFVARPLELDVYGAEAFFAVLAVWLFVAAGEAPKSGKFLAAAGFVAGLGWTVREQSSLLLAAFALLILVERRDILRSLAIVAVGFGAVVAVEMAIYALAAGDPFYRYEIDLGHRDIGVNDAMTPERAQLTARIARGARYLATTPATTPMLLLAALSAGYLRRTEVPEVSSAKTMRAFGVAALVSAILTPIVFNISATRYYPILTYAAFLIVGVAIATVWQRGRPGLAVAAISAVMLVNVAATDFNRDGQYAEAKDIAALAAAGSEPVLADSLNVNRARFQLRLRGWTEERAAASIRNIREVETGSLVYRSERAKIEDKPSCVLKFFSPRRLGLTHALIRETGISRLVGGDLERRTASPPPVPLIRILSKPGDVDPVSGKRCLQAVD
jgi:4-amino-4-deoxy-L-arabinose transferase-like glycosyltransferase